MNDAQLLDIVNGSGFPLQVAVEDLIRTKQEYWRIRHIEHAWNSGDSGGFIDLVIEDPRGVCILVLECKRPRDSSWVFMRSDGKGGATGNCMGWVVKYSDDATPRFGWRNIAVEPKSPEVPYCMVRGEGPGARFMLERIAGELVLATEALSGEEVNFRAVGRSEKIRAYFNVVVTTASLRIAEFAPADISLTDGTLSAGNFKEVPYLRFRKQLSQRLEPLGEEEYNHRALLALREQTVFVVNVGGLLEFLKDFDLHNHAWRELQFNG